MKFDIFPVCSRALGIFPLQTFDISTMGTCLNSKFFQFSQKFEKSEVFQGRCQQSRAFSNFFSAPEKSRARKRKRNWKALLPIIETEVFFFVPSAERLREKKEEISIGYLEFFSVDERSVQIAMQPDIAVSHPIRKGKKKSYCHFLSLSFSFWGHQRHLENILFFAPLDSTPGMFIAFPLSLFLPSTLFTKSITFSGTYIWKRGERAREACIK